ncbi:MAG: hypothetical protein FWG07_00275 [Treponema sp.]|nr:hypothetical protein [Treponema sp.]
MLVVTGIFDNERFIPDRPVSIPQKKKVTITIDDTETEHTAEAMPRFTMAQIEEAANSPKVQALVGVLKDAGLPENLTMKDIRQMRLEEKYGEYFK